MENTADDAVLTESVPKLTAEVGTLEDAETEYTTAGTLETELTTETATVQTSIEEEVTFTASEATATAAVEEMFMTLTTEEVADENIIVTEEAVKEKEIVAEENAANAQVIKNGLNSYYKSIVTKLEGVKFDGTQDIQILAKINTPATLASGTLFAQAFPATWGAKWESGGDLGQGKMLFLRDGRLAFDIGWTG